MSPDLSTRYLKLDLANPLVASCSPLTGHLDTLLRLEDAGISAVVLPSLFEEQIRHEEMELTRLADHGALSQPEAEDYFPPIPATANNSDNLLKLLSTAKERLEIPVIASLNGSTAGGWTRYAHELQDAGADAIELNIYLLAADTAISGAQIEERYVELVQSVDEFLTIPLAVKVGPYFSSLANMLVRLQQAGADGLVLFNRFLYPDIDLESLKVTPNLELSRSSEMRLPLRWIAIMRQHLSCSIAATSGVHRSEDLIKLLMAGADAVCMTSALLQKGPEHADDMLEELEKWMSEREYESVAQMRGSMAQQNYGNPMAFERANYMNELVSYTGPID
ncbi:MAG TPA: dihydroorotate dehydrogenase-like protein [Candidatus Krumholzibacteria bacterium]|jgi:dihydroorotate dehydrogenase (fumarate)